ncbi:helix-turn-helix domain-containing protein [Dyadobacter frigoris]|uniref:AraC family transcriptional regulator n=1 Tax=Dyadobacter frigoris TaxID=2576211 RepID=A0A4U6CTI3_9BACT|nr:helix-turn-helix domain-containing protein [Dyadobacter frigoris]TKT87980.1 AraC family transcriptional regulator [Dyadobacter frigoris]GLU52877.1 AraC family transcriptional regulator [Dyadobacter frigoris]
MKTILRIDTVSEHDAFYHHENLHPLVSVINFNGRTPEMYASRMNFGFYAIYLKDVKCGDMKYGRHTYDYQDRTLVFVAPGQIINVDINTDYKPQGYALMFHPDLIRGTALGKHMDDYSFFSYESKEALHLSEKERKIVLDCFEKIKYELELGTDKHSRKLIASNIELFLNYCSRFFDRQFITRIDVNKDTLEKFEDLLNQYFQSDKPQTIGLPAVAYCAEQLHLSPNYFGDLIKKETGKTAIEYIRLKVMDLAKEKVLSPDKSISEIAFELGFKYPQHFTRLFKKTTGLAPQDYRSPN